MHEAPNDGKADAPGDGRNQTAASEGNCPFGAVMADASGKVIACAHNTQNTGSDPTTHAEVNLIRKPAKKQPQLDFSQLTLVSNAEACSMCLSAAIKAGILY